MPSTSPGAGDTKGNQAGRVPECKECLPHPPRPGRTEQHHKHVSERTDTKRKGPRGGFGWNGQEGPSQEVACGRVRKEEKELAMGRGREKSKCHVSEKQVAGVAELPPEWWGSHDREGRPGLDHAGPVRPQ